MKSMAIAALVATAIRALTIVTQTQDKGLAHGP